MASTHPTLHQDWRSPRTARGFTAHQGSRNGQVTVLRCATNTPIPCTPEALAEMGKTRFNVTILSVADVGRASAPNKKQAGKYLKQPNTKQLFEMISDDQSITGVRMYSFRKANSNTDRGEREDEISASIMVGQILTFWVHEFMFQAKEARKDASKKGDDAPQTCLPSNVKIIPEFSIVDLHIMASHSGNVDKGYGINLKKLVPHPTSLYSYLTEQSLLSLPSSYAASLEKALTLSRDSPFIHNQVEVKNTSFFCKVPPNAFISAAQICENTYRLVGEGGAELFPGVPCVDIKGSDLLKFANVCPEGSGEEDAITDAITFFDFASAAGALYVYVTSVPSFKARDPALSDFMGVPVIDSERFLKGVSFEEGEELPEKACFPFGHPIVNLSDSPSITILTSPVFNSTGPTAPCPDFALMSEVCSVSKGYLVTVGSDEAPDVLRVVFNVMGCQLSPNGCPARLDYAARLGKRKAVGGAAGTPEED